MSNVERFISCVLTDVGELPDRTSPEDQPLMMSVTSEELESILRNAIELNGSPIGLHPDRGDGRKAHYGSGRQPYDDIKRLGWAPEFLAGSILKYLRRTKDSEHSLESARIYWRWLNDLVIDASDEDNHIRYVIKQLTGTLTPDELAKIGQ